MFRTGIHRTGMYRTAPQAPRPRRLVAVSAAGALLIGLLPVPAATASPTPGAAGTAASGTTASGTTAPGTTAPGSGSGAPSAAAAAGTWLDSGTLRVQVSTEFPQVLQYLDSASGSALAGNPATITSMLINGASQPVTATLLGSSTTQADYRLTFPRLPGIAITARLTVAGNVLTFAVTKIQDPAKAVASLQIPGHNLVSISSTQPGAQLTTTTISVSRTVSGDTFTPITAGTAVQQQPASSAYALVNTGELAATIETNSLYDSDSGPDQLYRGRVWHQITAGAGGARTVGLSSGQWLYRAPGAPRTEDLPWTKVVITADANGDKAVTWQDAAIAGRQILTRPYRGEETKKNVVTHIPFNFASAATHPFLRTLDDVKRIALSTDGLGQQALLKGYTSEGHDSANSDFGGNYNTRAGGLTDLNALLRGGKAYNATFGVHVNATEAYPESNMFSEKLIDPKAPGWNWLDQSYYIKQREDANSGALAGRIRQLAAETDDNLSFVYVDVFYKFGWLARNIQNLLIANNFRVSSEWSDKLQPNNIWSHWANDENYGGSDNKGINSTVLRFINNTQQDVWNPDPLLGGTHIVEFEGWTAQNNWNAFYNNIWRANVPTKFLQASELMSLTSSRAEFAGGVVSELRSGQRVVTLHGREVQRGNAYLLPWTDTAGAAVGDTRASKLYYYNQAAGTTTWELPQSFLRGTAGGNARLNIYRLTDQGRVPAGSVTVADATKPTGRITLNLPANQPFVLVPAKPGRGGPTDDAVKPTLPTQTAWGEGTSVVDPGFNAGELSAWNPQGTTSVERDRLGRTAAVLGAGPSSLSQQLGALAAGTYSVSAYVEIEPGKSRPFTLSVEASNGGKPAASNTIDRSTAQNYMGADERRGTFAQRLRVLVDVTEGERPVLRLAAGAGTALVRIDDVRVVKTERVAPPPDATSAVLAEDFENVDQGWGPFYKGDIGGSTDPRTHLAERNEPYTQKGWNGKPIDDVLAGNWSLKAHAERSGPVGLVYRTSQYSLPLAAGRAYRVSFDYQSSEANEYAWALGYDSAAGPKVVTRTAFGSATQTKRWVQEFTASSCGPNWIGLQRIGSSETADVILDNLLVEDLGPRSEQVACAQLSVSGTGAKIEPGGDPVAIPVTFTSDEAAPISNVTVALQVPAGWTAELIDGDATAASLPPGGSLRPVWAVRAPDGADGSYPLVATATYTRADGSSITLRTPAEIQTYPAPPTGTAYASDLEWISATNGWGPVERDQANGETGQGDGPPITLNGKVYAKGLGTHADARVRYFLGGKCSRFTATVGLDDRQKTRGSVTFAVNGDGRELAGVPARNPQNRTAEISADLTGVRMVELVVGDAGDGNGNDWADWADARFTCAP